MTRQLTYTQYYQMRPDEFRSGDEIAVKLVLAIGYSSDYAVYVGEEDESADHVSRHGDKVAQSTKVAEGLFWSAALGRHSRP